MVYKITDPEKVSSLFEGWEETMIWSCLQGVMGELYADSAEKPEAAMALLGDFCFFAGKPDRELTGFKPEGCSQDFIIMVPSDEQWAEIIENCYGERAKRRERYAIKKEGNIFDVEKLKAAVDSLPPEYTLQMMDETLFLRCREIPWCRDLVSQYSDYEKYKSYGLGAVILKDGEPVSGASSYSGYQGGIEIEIDTREDFRRRGLAYVCGAKLILECLKRDWYPSWDAQNQWSVALAQKLGYHFDYVYPVYEIWGY